MRILCGPLIDKEYQPFDQCLRPDWHIASDGEILRRDGDPALISFELRDARHGLLSHVMPLLPPGWQPDLVLIVIPERFVLPHDLADLPCPLAVLVADWYFSFEMLRALAPLFDHWIVDHTAVPLLRQAGIENVAGFQVFALDLARFAALPDEAPSYDIGFIGNLRTAVHSRRAHYLARLAGLSGRWRVGIATERYGADYVRFFNQCRLIFNYSIHGEFNMRCFEALGCGRLMLLEAQNQEVPRFLSPGEHYVSYRSEDLEAQIDYYLAHDDARERIARAGQAAIQGYGARQSWDQLRAVLAAGLAAGSIRVRPDRRLSAAARLQNQVWSVNPPYNQLQVAGETLQARIQAAPDPAGLNDLAVLHYTTWLAAGAVPDSPSLATALTLLDQALRLCSVHPLAAYNRAQLLALAQDGPAALAGFKDCLAQLDQAGTDWPWGLAAYPKLHLMYEKFYHPWHMAQSQLEYAYAGDPARLAAERARLLRAHALRHLGDLELDNGDLAAATATWDEALRTGRHWLRDLLPNYLLCCLELGWPAQALRAWASGWGDPLAPELWLMHCRALAAAGQTQAAAAWHQHYARMKASFLGSLDGLWEHLFAGWPAPAGDAIAAWQAGLLAQVPAALHPAPEQYERWLFAWCGLSWRLDPEPPPDFGGHLGVDSAGGEHFQYLATLTEIAHEPVQLHRCYDRPSDLAQGLLGIDLLPCSFPQTTVLGESELPVQLDELPTAPCLMLLADFETLPLAELAQLAQLAAPPPVVLWCPRAEPDAAETEALAEQLAPFEKLDLMLMPRLRLAEQRLLLARSAWLWLPPRGQNLYYLWWGLSLGLQPWLSEQPAPDLTCPGFACAELAPFVGPAPVSDPAAQAVLRQGLAAWQQQAPARRQACAWILRTWMLRQNWVGPLWQQAEPHLNPVC